MEPPSDSELRLLDLWTTKPIDQFDQRDWDFVQILGATRTLQGLHKMVETIASHLSTYQAYLEKQRRLANTLRLRGNPQRVGKFWITPFGNADDGAEVYGLYTSPVLRVTNTVRDTLSTEILPPPGTENWAFFPGGPSLYFASEDIPRVSAILEQNGFVYGKP